ncbi:MAG TPA: endonuclease [Bacteroidales bacterium]|jgi:putative endonuclease|nr:endonuclease [Bacteroidales bacterium]HBZ20334.1 endonuclease [Bacteroidales bacterium]
MSESQTLGQTGEGKAVLYLKESGYKIRHRNWRSGKKELDIVAENNDFVVFVEVKTRTEGFLGKLSDAVSREKQRLMIFAAEAYLKKYEITKESRFDVITVLVKGQTFEIEQHIEDAFYPTLR